MPCETSEYGSREKRLQPDNGYRLRAQDFTPLWPVADSGHEILRFLTPKPTHQVEQCRFLLQMLCGAWIEQPACHEFAGKVKSRRVRHRRFRAVIGGITVISGRCCIGFVKIPSAHKLDRQGFPARKYAALLAQGGCSGLATARRTDHCATHQHFPRLQDQDQDQSLAHRWAKHRHTLPRDPQKHEQVHA